MPKTKQFNRAEVLNQTMLVFWQKGYEATSVQDIMRATGLKPGSLYDTFGGKHGLFMEAIAHYRQTIIEPSLRVLQTPGSVKAAIRNYFELLQHKFGQADRQLGCLMSNTTAELAQQDKLVAEVVSQHLQEIETGFRQALERGIAQGEFRASLNPLDLARFFTTSVAGLSIISKTAQSGAYLPPSIEILLELLN